MPALWNACPMKPLICFIGAKPIPPGHNACPASPVAPADGTGVAPADGTGAPCLPCGMLAQFILLNLLGFYLTGMECIWGHYSIGVKFFEENEPAKLNFYPVKPFMFFIFNWKTFEKLPGLSIL